LPGSQAEAVAVPLADANLVRLPDALSDDNALLLTDCAMTAWYGAHNARIKRGSTVVVVGLGPIGLLTVIAALLHGAARVIGIDPIDDRRARASELGAIAVTPDEADDVTMSLTRAGADSVVEVAGSTDTVALALRLVRPGGCVSVVGTATTDSFPFPLATAQQRGIELRTGLARYIDLAGLLELVVTGRFDPSVVISHRFALAKGADAYELGVSRADGVCKVVLDPRA
jgi:alcohol dehydrogenase